MSDSNNYSEEETVLFAIVDLIESSNLNDDMACAVLCKALASLATATLIPREVFLARVVFAYEYEKFNNPQPTEVH